jgi:transposase
MLEEELAKARTCIEKLEQENAQLKAKLKIVHQRQFKANKKKKEPSDKRTDKKQKKKRGAPKGHPGWSRPTPGHIDKTIEVPAPDQCPHCGCDHLSQVEKVKNHLQEDIILQPRTHVTNFKHHQAFCPKCDRLVIQAAENELPNCQIGPVAKAAAVYLRYGLGLPYRKVQRLFKDFFDLSFVPATAMNFDRQAARNGSGIYEDLKEKLRVAASAYCDETFWRQDGDNHYVWYAGNDDLDVFHIDKHRTQEVAQQILGNDFDGVIIADGYAGYNGVNPVARQSCLAHLIRKAKEIKKEILLCEEKHQDKKAITFCDDVKNLLKDACHIGQKVKGSSDARKNAGKYKHQLQRRLKKICKIPLSDKNAENFRNRLLDTKREYKRLFVFLDYPDIEPTNNHAERALRKLVIFRKICFGTRSAQGSYCHSVLPSLISTATRQGKHPIEFFHTLFVSDPATAQAELYNNSS